MYRIKKLIENTGLFIGRLLSPPKRFTRKAKLIGQLVIDHPSGEVELDEKTELTFLYKEDRTYWFCIKKLHGTGQSGLGLKRNEFKWIKL